MLGRGRGSEERWGGVGEGERGEAYQWLREGERGGVRRGGVLSLKSFLSHFLM